MICIKYIDFVRINDQEIHTPSVQKNRFLGWSGCPTKNRFVPKKRYTFNVLRGSWVVQKEPERPEGARASVHTATLSSPRLLFAFLSLSLSLSPPPPTQSLPPAPPSFRSYLQGRRQQRRRRRLSWIDAAAMVAAVMNGCGGDIRGDGWMRRRRPWRWMDVAAMDAAVTSAAMDAAATTGDGCGDDDGGGWMRCGSDGGDPISFYFLSIPGSSLFLFMLFFPSILGTSLILFLFLLLFFTSCM